MNFIDKVDKIIDELNEKNSFEFEKAVQQAFEVIGFKSKWIGEKNESQPDVLLESWLTNSPYLVTIECYASKSDSGQANKVKVGQIRQNGPKFIDFPEYKGHIENLYLAVVSRGGFNNSAIDSSGGDVSLIDCKWIIQLLMDLKNGITYSQKALENIFNKGGLMDEHLETLRNLKQKHILNLGIICYTVENHFKHEISPLKLETVLGKVSVLNNLLKNPINNIQIISDIEFLSNPVVSIINLSKDRNAIIYSRMKNNIHFDKLGNLGKTIKQFYLAVSKEFQPKRFDTSGLLNK